MFIDKLLQPAVQQFILENEKADPFSLSLNQKEIAGVSISLIAQQIEARKKAKRKLPTWFNSSNIVYPAKVSVEQSSSELAAHYKASLVDGSSFVDLTAGMGVDSWALSPRFKKGINLEQNVELAQITTHNLTTLGINNVEVLNTTAESFLNTNSQKFDLIYLDPARRNEHAKKVFHLEDCTPNVVELLPQLKKIGKRTLVKTAPLMDINLSIKSLPGVSEVHVVSVNNECKEVLYLIDENGSNPVRIVTVNIKEGGIEKFEFTRELEEQIEINLNLPKTYLYEPNASIMKAGGFKSIANQFNLTKLHSNTHLYTSNDINNDFPGRVFHVAHLINSSKKEFQQLNIGSKANVSTRNFPESPEQIKKKLKIKDGGEFYLFAFSNVDSKKQLAVCTKVNKS